MSNGLEGELPLDSADVPRAEDVRVQLPPPPRSRSQAAWLLGRAFNELQHRLQVERVTGADSDRDRTGSLWGILAVLVDDLLDQEERFRLHETIAQIRAGWDQNQASEPLTEEMARINLVLIGKVPLDVHFQDDVELLTEFAQAAIAILSDLQGELLTACGDDRDHFEHGALADQLIHPLVKRGRVIWVQPPGESEAPVDVALTGTDWATVPRKRDRGWGFPSELPDINPAWPDAAWRIRLNAFLTRVNGETIVLTEDDLTNENRLRLMDEIGRYAPQNQRASSPDENADDSLDPPKIEVAETKEVPGDSTLYHGIKIEGNRVTRAGYEKTITLTSRLDLAILNAFVDRRERPHMRIDLEDNWEAWGGSAEPEPNTISSQLSQLNGSIRSLRLRIRSVGRNMGWCLMPIDEGD